MTRRTASCSCGQLRVTCEGEPGRISICHCLDCQRRTGSIFGMQARFAAKQVEVAGVSTSWTRQGDSGSSSTFHSCPRCSATVYWQPDGAPELVYVAVGAFADPTFPPPRVSVYEERRHGWAGRMDDLPIVHEA
ncbi:GFA family protein [uncultured Sphingomonas sp.]|uniref:GFA family protein n=1 Tax=unclassified Sphingomonas TaxID=196159 RepID=UPI002601198A|nr:GFA family protein [uncultured Sphingomonas sp.]